MAGVISTAILRTQTDERLVALARAGHKRAFEAIAERYRPELTRALRRILPPASVEDALQQTHLQAWQALAGGTEVRELRAWLHRIARNAAIAASSRGYDYDELKDALVVSPGPYEDLERREAVRRALRGIAELPERQRAALLAVAVDGRSHAEVGVDLGITDTAARQLVRRARVSLLALMSVATPPQLVRWAARAGHSAAAGKATAGKAAAGKAAAGTGLGSIGGSALKVGVIAVTVGGVAAGVAPIRHALAPPAKPAAHHHRAHRSSPGVYVTAAVSAPLARSASLAGPSHHSRPPTARDHRTARDAGPLVVAAVGTTSPGVTVVAPATSVAAATPGAVSSPPAATATSSQASVAALWAWWLAHHSHEGSAAAGASTSGGASTEQPQGERAPWSVDHQNTSGSTGGDSPQCTPSDPAAASSATASGSAAGSPSGQSRSAAASSSTGPRSASASMPDQPPWSSEQAGLAAASTPDRSAAATPLHDRYPTPAAVGASTTCAPSATAPGGP